MDIEAFLRQICALSGHSGMEDPVAQRIAQEFRLYSDSVRQDALGNVIAAMGDPEGPTVLLCAHMDEIGLIATGFDERGGVRFHQLGGVDPRILPGMEVVIRGREDVYGVIGAKPPHLSSGPQQAPKMKDLRVDTGLSPDEARALVRVGDPISFKVPLTKLLNGRVAGKSFDDRACVAVLLCAMEELRGTKLACNALFCATVQEEVGLRGAMTAGYGANPDMAIALDVTFGHCPGVDKNRTHPLDSIPITRGPLLHPALEKRLRDAAERVGVKTSIETAASDTGTDANGLQLAREGVPTGLISVPLSYMHTAVETIREKTVAEAGRLVAAFLKSVDADWRQWLCLDD